MTINLENLDLLPHILEKLNNLENEIKNLKLSNLDLTARAGVKEFLNISDSTLNVMMNDGRFIPGVHFTKEFKGKKPKITFVKSAIIEFKKGNK